MRQRYNDLDMKDDMEDVLQNPPIDDFARLLDVASIAITPSSPSFSHSSTQQLTATATMDDGSKVDISAAAGVVWNSASTSKMTVSVAGLLTGVAAGTSVITVTYAGKSTSVTATAT